MNAINLAVEILVDASLLEIEAVMAEVPWNSEELERWFTDV